MVVKVNFMQGSCIATQVARNVKFKMDERKFEEDFMVCKLGGMDMVLGNTFLHYYGVEVRKMPNAHLVKVGSNGQPQPLPFTRMAGLDGLGINLIKMSKLYNEQVVLIMKGIDSEVNAKGKLPSSCV